MHKDHLISTEKLPNFSYVGYNFWLLKLHVTSLNRVGLSAVRHETHWELTF